MIRTTQKTSLPLHLKVGRNRLVLFPEHPRVITVPVVPPDDAFRRTQYVRRFVVVVDMTEYDPQKVEYWHFALEEESLMTLRIRMQKGTE